MPAELAETRERRKTKEKQWVQRKKLRTRGGDTRRRDCTDCRVKSGLLYVMKSNHYFQINTIIEVTLNWFSDLLLFKTNQSANLDKL